ARQTGRAAPAVAALFAGRVARVGSIGAAVILAVRGAAQILVRPAGDAEALVRLTDLVAAAAMAALAAVVGIGGQARAAADPCCVGTARLALRAARAVAAEAAVALVAALVAVLGIRVQVGTVGVARVVVAARFASIAALTDLHAGLARRAAGLTWLAAGVPV